MLKRIGSHYLSYKGASSFSMFNHKNFIVKRILLEKYMLVSIKHAGRTCVGLRR